MAERDLEQLFRRRLTARGALVVKVVPAGVVGVPDRLVLHAGRVWLVELKTATGQLRPDQIAWHRKAAQRGVDVVVLSGRDEIETWITSLPDQGG